MATKNPPDNKPHKMDDDKVDSLKSLNTRLIKETVEKRQQVDSLINTKNHFESEFNRSVMDKESLKHEMGLVSESVVRLEIEKGVLFDYVKEEANRVVRGMEVEIGGLKRRLEEVVREIGEEREVSVRVGGERDEVKARLEVRVREVEELRVKVAEAEEKEGRVLGEVKELRGECERLMVESEGNERRVESVTKEKEFVLARLSEAKRLVDELKGQNKVVAEEKVVLESKNYELRASVDELKKLVESMRIEEGILREKLAVLEEKHAASLRNEVEMQSEIDRLVEDKKEAEKRVELLGKEKNAVVKDLEDVTKELGEQKLSFERVVQEKVELEGVKIQQESEIVKMNERLSEFKDKISSLDLGNVNHTKKVKELEVKVGSYKASLDKATMERDEAIKQLKDEKAITANFKQTVTRMQHEMADLNEKLAALITENGKHSGEKKQLEDRCAEMAKEVASLEAKFAESRVEFDGKLGAAEATSTRVLNILKKTVLACDENNDFEENGVEEGIKEHVAEIEAIKVAFKDKESRLEEMKRQLELVKSSVGEGKKEKSFWTMVTSATTLLAAAASLVYVVRAH